MVSKISPSSDTLGQGLGADSAVTLGSCDWDNEWDSVINIIRVMVQLICDGDRGLGR